MFEFVFPLKTYLHILQLEQYKLDRWLRWWVKHPLKRLTDSKKPVVWTARLKLISLISLIGLIGLIFVDWRLGLISFFFPVIPVVIAGIIFSPFYWVIRQSIKHNTQSKINLLKNNGKLLVIGISGSYGKTSVKEYLYQILKTKYRVVRTPESYNTLLGIAKVVDLEVDESTQIFICEMGAFEKGEIAELCDMVQPDYAMLTGLNEQHLERFGSLENEIEGESESVEYVLAKGGQVVVNTGNSYIKQKWDGVPGVVEYGEGNWKTPMQQNIAGAKVMARVLGMSLADIEEVAKNLKQPEHRLAVITRGQITVIDDAYSANTDGFRAAVNYLHSFEGHKVIVTPGIVELGNQTARIHQELGQYMHEKVDQVILVGKNDRTINLDKGYGGEVEYITDVKKAMERVTKLPAVVLFENDLPDNY